MSTTGRRWAVGRRCWWARRSRPAAAQSRRRFHDRADRRLDHHPASVGLHRAGLHETHRAGARRRRRLHQHRDAVPRLRAVSDERERWHLHAGRAGPGQGAGLGRLRPRVAGQQPHRRLRRARHAPDEEVRGRGGHRRRRLGGEPARGARGQVPRDAEGAHRAHLGGLDVPRSFARRTDARRRAGAPRAQPAALHHHLCRDQGTLRAAPAGGRRAHRADARGRRQPDLRRPPLRRRRDPGDPHRAAQGGRRRDRRGGEERGHARRSGHRHHPRPRGRHAHGSSRPSSWSPSPTR